MASQSSKPDSSCECVMRDAIVPRLLLTGGSGRLGRELSALLPLVAPSHAEMDITVPLQVEAALDEHRPEVVIHAAAYTDVAAAQRDRDTCRRINVIGTENVARAAAQRDVLLVFISTDYVFDGVRGNYSEDDPPGPPFNYYGETKLAAEQAARTCPRHLVIRTSFRPRQWPYETAYTDVFTSQDYVDVIAPQIALAIRNVRRVGHGTLHIATERKSVYELAMRRRPDVRPASKRQAPVPLPDDVSLDIRRWTALKEQWHRKETER